MEMRPAQLLLVRFEEPGCRPAGCLLLALVALFDDVHEPGKHQERDLFNHAQRIGNTAGPEFSPEFVDAILQFSCNHCSPSRTCCGGPNESTNSINSAICRSAENKPAVPSASMRVNGSA